MMEMMELADKNDKTTMIIILRYLKENRHNEKRNGRYKDQIKLLKMKNTISERKNSTWQLAAPKASDQREKKRQQKEGTCFL